ncbi:MAG: condensation domain-containing protein [Nostoc sp.]|uniref:condensation domain-containing protein n=1 Tax=Nostoc sp. TaxID=1180 RepID=UPI002FF76624
MNKFSYSFLETSRNCSTVVEVLNLRSSTQPNRDAFTLLLHGEAEKMKNRIEVDLEVEVSVADFFEGMSQLRLVTKILAQLTTDALPSISQGVPLTLVVEDLSCPSDSDRSQEAQPLAIKLAQQPFDLSAQSLLRTKILKINDKNYQLLVTLYHIIANGWSISILIKELATLYEAFSKGKVSPLAELPIQHRDFVNWQQKWLDSERIQPKLAYWKQKLSGELTGIFALQSIKNNPAVSQIILPSLRYSYDRKPDLAFLLKTLGRLWLARVQIDWAGFYAHEHRYLTPLPAYLF